MNKKRFVALGAALILAMAFVLPSCAPAPLAEKEPITIGFVHSLTGVYAGYGLDQKAAAEIAIVEINQAGGVLGRPLKLIARDDKVNPEVGLREAKDLVFTEKVDFLMGTVSSAAGLAISEFAKSEKIIFFDTCSQSDVITAAEGHRYVVRISTNTAGYCRTGARWAAELPYTKWYQIDPDYTYGKSCSRLFREELTRLRPDVEFLGQDWPKLGCTDYSPYITKILGSGAEACYSSVAGSDFITWVSQATPFGYFDKVYHMGHDLGELEVTKGVGADVPSGKIAGGNHFAFWMAEKAYGKAAAEKASVFTTEYHDKTGAWPSLGACGYVATYILADTINKVGALDTEKIIDALEGATFDTIVGPLHINDYDHQALWPFVFGTIVLTPDYPFGIVSPEDAMVFPVEEVYQTEAEVLKLRGK